MSETKNSYFMFDSNFKNMLKTKLDLLKEAEEIIDNEEEILNMLKTPEELLKALDKNNGCFKRTQEICEVDEKLPPVIKTTSLPKNNTTKSFIPEDIALIGDLVNEIQEYVNFTNDPQLKFKLTINLFPKDYIESNKFTLDLNNQSLSVEKTMLETLDLFRTFAKKSKEQISEYKKIKDLDNTDVFIDGVKYKIKLVKEND